ncbi:MAG: hypothetical protein ABR583_00020 [Gaiellaceae bacterium]
MRRLRRDVARLREEKEIKAEHAQLLLTPPESVDGAVELLREAAGRAAAEAGLESAVRYLRRALEEPLAGRSGASCCLSWRRGLRGAYGAAVALRPTRP